MKHIFYLILGILLVILTSTATVSVMTVKPATPKSTIVLETSWGLASETKKQIEKYTKYGYIVRSTVSVDTRALIVLEKY